MAKSKGSKRGKKRKRVAAHIKDAAEKRRNSLGLHASGLPSDSSTPSLGSKAGSKRPRQSLTKTSDPTRKERDRDEAEKYLRAWAAGRQDTQAQALSTSLGLARPAWKFNKNIQAWLLRHMLVEEEVSKEDFDIACLYLEGLQGGGRQRVLDEARLVIAKHGPDDEQEEAAEQPIELSGRVRFAEDVANGDNEDEDEDEDTDREDVDSEDGQQTGPKTKKPRKARSALTGALKAEVKAKAVAVAYERALRIAEILT